MADVQKALIARVKAGARLRAGVFEIDSAPPMLPVEPGLDPRLLDELPHDVYLVHVARRDPTLDDADHEYYRLKVFVDADTNGRLDEIEEVTYHLHPTFEEPIRKVTDRSDSFSLRTSAWGEFNMTAEIRFKDESKLIVERFINLGGSLL